MTSADETRARERRDRWMQAYCAAFAAGHEQRVFMTSNVPIDFCAEAADLALAAFDKRFPARTAVRMTADGPVPCSGLFEGLSDANPA